MKSDAIFKKYLTAEHAEIAEIKIIFFSAFSHRGVGPIPYGPEAVNSAVNDYVFCSISLSPNSNRCGSPNSIAEKWTPQNVVFLVFGTISLDTSSDFPLSKDLICKTI